MIQSFPGYDVVEGLSRVGAEGQQAGWCGRKVGGEFGQVKTLKGLNTDYRPRIKELGSACLKRGLVPRRGGEGGVYRSSLDARKPQNPTKSEEYQGHLQGVLHGTRGAQTSKTLVTIVVHVQDSKEQTPCATYWFLGLAAGGEDGRGEGAPGRRPRRGTSPGGSRGTGRWRAVRRVARSS
eukprot:1181529-Prorocentrum_minimum.AAC.2